MKPPEGLNIFEQFDYMLCQLVLEAKDKKERLVAVMARDIYQAAMRHINDKALLGPDTTQDDTSNRVLGLAKGASLLAGMAAALSAPGGDPASTSKLLPFTGTRRPTNGARSVCFPGLQSSLRCGQRKKRKRYEEEDKAKREANAIGWREVKTQGTKTSTDRTGKDDCWARAYSQGEAGDSLSDHQVRP